MRFFKKDKLVGTTHKLRNFIKPESFTNGYNSNDNGALEFDGSDELCENLISVLEIEINNFGKNSKIN